MDKEQKEQNNKHKNPDKALENILSRLENKGTFLKHESITLEHIREKITIKNQYLNQQESIKSNKILAEFWQKPLVEPKAYLGLGRGILPRDTKEQVALFLRLYSHQDSHNADILNDPDLSSAKKFFTKKLNYDLLAFLYSQQPSNLKPSQNIIVNWLTLCPQKDMEEELTKYSNFCNEITESYASLDKPNQFSEKLSLDLSEINKTNEDAHNEIILVNLRTLIAKELFSRLGLSKLQKNKTADESLVNLIKNNPETYYMVLALEKLYLSRLVIKLKEHNNNLRNSLSKELEEKEGLNFNLRIANPTVSQVIHNAQKEPGKLEQVLFNLKNKDILKVALAYYLDSWSRYWQEDKEYSDYFQGENAYLNGSCFPINNNCLVIPEVKININAVMHDIENKGITNRFIPNHLPAIKLPLSAKLAGNSLEFAINNEPIGSFPGDIIKT